MTFTINTVCIKNGDVHFTKVIGLCVIAIFFSIVFCNFLCKSSIFMYTFLMYLYLFLFKNVLMFNGL